MKENEFNLENNDEYYWIELNPNDFNSFADSEYNEIKKNDPNKKIGLKITSISSELKSIDYSKYSTVKISNIKINQLTITDCIFKNLLFENTEFSKLKLENCKTFNGKISIYGINPNSYLNIEIVDCSISINSNFPIRFSFDGSSNLISNSKFEDRIEIYHKNKIEFNDCSFLNDVADQEVSSLGSLIFDNCKIMDEKYFFEIENSDLKISKSKVNYLRFSPDNKYKNLIDIVSSKIELLDINKNITSINLEKTAITDFILNGEITEKAIFNNVTFKNPPEIGDIKFKNCNVEFRDVKFLDTHSPQAIAGFRALNKACRDANYHHGEIFFHGLELETRFNMLVERSYLFKWFLKNTKIANFIKHFLYFLISFFFFISKDGIERFLLCFHKLFSDFGRSLLLPLFWLLIFAIVVCYLNFTQINSSNNITENLIDKECESAKINVNELPKISKKITFKNSIGPLQLALPKQFISDDEIKCYHHKANFFIDSLNFIHAVISYAIWFVWFFMIRARFRL
jgi:uncharacterized protein YjbI with pentapeptide repeats